MEAMNNALDEIIIEYRIFWKPSDGIHVCIDKVQSLKIHDVNEASLGAKWEMFRRENN